MSRDELTRAEVNAINRRADERNAAVNFHFAFKSRATRRVRLIRAVVMNQKDSNALARDHKQHSRGNVTPATPTN